MDALFFLTQNIMYFCVSCKNNMIEYIGYIGALFIGLILGITGGGGSILTVPLLVYVLGFEPSIAAAYSLFIIGTTSLFGTIQNNRKGLVEIKQGLTFAIPSVISVYLTRKFIVPHLPKIIFETNFITVSKDVFLMVLFATVMLFAAISMLKKTTNTSIVKSSLVFDILKIFSIGILIGLIGAGGGFLIIPALFHVAKLPIKKAIGTSLLIISINSLVGFLGDFGHINIHWEFLLTFTFISILGIYLGIYLGKFIAEKKLKKIFGWFILIMAVVILMKEIVF